MPAARSISLTGLPPFYPSTRPLVSRVPAGSESSPHQHAAPVQAFAVALDEITSVLSETEGLRLRGRSTASAYAACDITSPASKLVPLFHTAKVTAAMLRAIITRANSGLNPRVAAP